MAYWDVALIAADTDISQRVTAAAALEGNVQDPYTVWSENVWYFASQPGWGDAWASAIAAGITQPGRNPTVISDGQILSAIQALPEDPLPEE
jgi:hypothetical protein